jgi:REP element-mobilizing transposase RayT
MPLNPAQHHRRSLRLPHYDYASQGAYFITVCVHQQVCLFGTVDDGCIHLTQAGQMIDTAWQGLPQRFSAVVLDAYVVMPNHLHGIVVLTDLSLTLTSQSTPPLLGRVVGAFKSLTTNAYIAGVRDHGWPAFAGRLWQRNYYEHVVRDEVSLQHIREYIDGNPAHWSEDPEHPQRHTAAKQKSDHDGPML